MSSSQHPPTVKPDIEFAVDLLAQIAAGRLRPPRFQRPFVWRPEQMRDLFDSIEQGYPVGTLLLWDTAEPHRSLEAMGALPLPAAPSGMVSYLLDGHQRLSTLYSVLKLPADHPRSAEDDSWTWWIYRDLKVEARSVDHVGGRSSARFDHVRTGPVPVTHFPLRASLKTTDFLDFVRKLDKELDKQGRQAELDALVARAEDVTTRIKSYKIGLVRVVGGTLSQAVEIFSRLNSKGQKILPDQMVAALTYREDGDGGFSLAERLDETQDALSSLDFGELPREVVFRTVLAATGESDIQRTDWSRLARTIGDEVADSIEAAHGALTNAVKLLQRDIGVAHIRLVPYSAQLVQLAAFFLDCPDPTKEQRDALCRWFWSTSFSGWFAGANTTTLKRMIESMRAFAAGAIEAGELLGYAEQALPYPTRFDLKSARLRSLLLWQVRRPGPLDLEAEAIDVREQIALHETRAWRYILTSQLRKSSAQSDPANRILLPLGPGKSVRQAIVELRPNDAKQARILASHCISPEAHGELVAGNYEEFVAIRSRALMEGERQFISDLGLETAEQETGEPGFDTELNET